MKKTNIQFLGKNTVFFVGVSLLLVLASTMFFFAKGLNYGIDFTGGKELHIKTSDTLTVSGLSSFLESSLGLKKAKVYQFNDQEAVISLPPVEGQLTSKQKENLKSSVQIKNITNALSEKYSDFQTLRVDYVGSQVGSELKSNGLWALVYSLVLILIYIALRFDFMYAPSAVICIFHDVIIVIGVYIVLGKEFNLQTLAALLTIVGYSLNDTIITFDRIRENVGEKIPTAAGLKDIINLSINSMMSRTLLTSLTTLMFVGTLYFVTTGVMKDIAFTLGLGVIIGTYSSIYVASPLVYLFQTFTPKN